VGAAAAKQAERAAPKGAQALYLGLVVGIPRYMHMS